MGVLRASGTRLAPTEPAGENISARSGDCQPFKEGSGLIGVHPNDNTATVWLKAEDLIRIIENNGNEVHVVEI